MKRPFYRHLLLFLLIPFIQSTSYAQDLTGIWKGYFISDEGEYYKLEFQVAQSNSYGVTGVSYSYLDIRFYGKATMTGTFIKPSSSFRIREIKTVEVKSSFGMGTCIMNYNFKYSRSGKEEFLEGTYLGKYETAYQSDSPGRWGDCGGGKVFLRRVKTSDFYVEPFLRNKIKNVPIIDNQPPLRKDSAKTNPTTTPAKKPIVINKPPVKKPVTKTNTTPAKKPVVVTKPVTKPVTKINTTPPKKPVVITKPPVTKTNTTPAKKPVVITKLPVSKPIVKTNTPTEKKIVIDTTQKVSVPIAKIIIPPVSIPEVLKTRTNELVKVLTVNYPDIMVKLYDNGEIDGDTISVYLDKKLVLGSKGLTASPLIVKFNIDDDAEHELIMVAENLGRIPPNTSLMIVEAGEQRFDVRITSTEQKNAMVKFKYQKPK